MRPSIDLCGAGLDIAITELWHTLPMVSPLVFLCVPFNSYWGPISLEREMCLVSEDLACVPLESRQGVADASADRLPLLVVVYRVL